MSRRHGRGYIRDAKRHYTPLALAAEHIGLKASSASGEANLLQFAPPVLDQGGTSACFGHGTATLLATSYAAKGAPLPWIPSPAGIYNVARCAARTPLLNGTYAPLADEGAQPSAGFMGLHVWGIRPMGARASDGRMSDCDPATINVEEKLGELEAEVVHPIYGPYDIDGTVATRVDMLRRCIDSQIPVGVGGFVDSAFENWNPVDPAIGAPNQSDANGGGHWMALLGYRTRTDATTEFLIRNSWGPDWGDGGTAWTSPAWIEALWQIIAVTVTP